MRELQIQFQQGIYNPTEKALYPHIQDARLTAKQSLNIYRNNIIFTFTKQLKNIYPTIQALIGDACFAGLAREYMPYDKKQRGLYFSQFFADYAPAQALPYLSEVAQLEWTCYELLKSTLETESRVLSFQFPIFKIWCLCQADSSVIQDEYVNLDDGGETIRVTRRGFEIYLEKIV